MAEEDRRQDPKSRGKDEDVPASSSDRVRLEVSILASGSNDTAAVDEQTGEPASYRTVLVVAADSDMRSYVRGCLRHHERIRVVEVTDGEAALAATRLTLPDVVIIDMAHRGTAATVLGSARQARRVLTRVPLIVITDDEPDDGGAQILGGAALALILVKPFNAQQLCGRVEDLLSLNSRPEPDDHT
jgi:DNA-binding response OmpR family regulator